MRSKAFMCGIIVMVAMLSRSTVSATITSPDALVKNTTQEVLDVIKTTTDRRKLVQIAEGKVVQNFDFERMTKLAVGKSWRKATMDQQRALIMQFKDLLVRTYADALANGTHSNATLKMMPFRMPSGDADVTVETQITESARKPIEVDYHMENTPSGWKVYDVIVDNVSLVMNYRSSFSEEINKSGIDGLIKQLEAKNNSLASDTGSKAQ